MIRKPTVQPDLFGELDAAEERARIWNQPQTCPRCGRREPNGLQLSNNHGIDPGTDTIGGFDRDSHPTLGELCMAQWLVRNHIIHRVFRRYNHAYPKCDQTSMSSSESSDCRAGWPACISYKEPA